MHIGYFDGATGGGNPGKLGLGACIYNSDGEEIDKAASFRPYGTNNDSEYMSLVLLLTRAVKLGITEIKVFGDSKLIINQVTGKFTASEKFLPFLNAIRELRQNFDSIEFEWIRREKNNRADELSKKGLLMESVYYENRQIKSKQLKYTDNPKQLKYTDNPKQIDIEGSISMVDKHEANTGSIERISEIKKVLDPENLQEKEDSKTSNFKTLIASQKAIKEVEVKPSFKVSFINKEVLAITESNKFVVAVNVRLKKCSCEKYSESNECKHISALKSLLK
jgi:ribonuclease HI